MVLGRRHIGNEVCVTNTVLLRSRMMRKYQVRFWRAAALVRESPTLIVAAAQVVLVRGLAAVGHTVKMLSEGKAVALPVMKESPHL